MMLDVNVFNIFIEIMLKNCNELLKLNVKYIMSIQN